MRYNGKLDIAIGTSAKTLNWINKKMLWSDLVDKIRKEHKTHETYKEYLKASKDEQSKIKDVGGFVGGYLKNGRRKPENVLYRQLLTLDIDFAYMEFWEDFTLNFHNAAILHSTHKHSESNPRFRLIMPLSRNLNNDEYVAVGRKVASILGIDLFDSTTFEPNRLMYWQSTSSDMDYYFKVQDGEWLDCDEILGMYNDWHDSSLWATAQRESDKIKSTLKQQEDPAIKKGVVGVFCRTYTVSEAIEKFLSEEYTPVDNMDNRYTYIKGTTSGGLIIYDDKFAYSHHGTDPCGGKLCNAFDLVRIHKFGHLDDKEQSTEKAKSYIAMVDFAMKDVEVKKIIAEENIKDANYDFSERADLENIDNTDWMQHLEIDKNGRYLSTAANINLILQEDARLKGIFKQNNFDNKRYVFYSPPWRKINNPEPIRDVDFSGLRNYIETIYGIVGNLKIDDSVSLVFEKNSYHPIKEYLDSLIWDGESRIDNLLIDYFGVDDTPYHREVIRITLVAAVARVFNPGVKFDTVLVLVGEQGTGKSTFVNKLSMDWGSDTFLTVHGKEAFEQLHGAWIIEMAELSGLKKAEVESIKHFISKQEDTFRPAYGRTSETYKRQCVFIGTINTRNFLRDSSGNRRFLPVDIKQKNATKSVFNDFRGEELNQIWAEATSLYKSGVSLILSKEASFEALKQQREHSEEDERAGVIEQYLETELPDNWGDIGLQERRFYLDSPTKTGIVREVVCVAEVWCECLNKELHAMDRWKTREINDILRNLPNWEQQSSTKNFKNYGKQKYYTRKSID